MPAVSDTSPLLVLAAIDLMHLLQAQFGAVFIAPDLYQAILREAGE
jgi:predicted nucleic acid-binding protein